MGQRPIFEDSGMTPQSRRNRNLSAKVRVFLDRLVDVFAQNDCLRI